MRAGHVVLAIATTIAWGFTFVVIEVGLQEFPPLLFAALRFAVAAFPAVLFLRRDGIAWRWILAVGLSLGLAQQALLFLGVAAGMPAGMASLVLQTQAVFTMILAALLLGDIPSRRQWVGVGVGLVGIALIAGDGALQAALGGFVLVVGAGLAWGVGNIAIKKANVPNGFRLLVWMALVPILPLLLASAAFETGQWEALAGLDWIGVGSVLFAGLVSSLFCYGSWAYLLHRSSPNAVAPFSLLVPVFGLSFGALLLGERLDARELIGSGVVLAGLLVVVVPGRRAPRASARG